MPQTAASVNFASSTGRLRPRLHGCGYMPGIATQNIRDFAEDFAKLRFHEARTHDQALANPGQRVVDTHFVFPNIKADPRDPANYYFAATDQLLETCLDCGTSILYRLGTSIEHTLGRHFNALMPDDSEHYAEVMAGIVRHYTRGWAGGFEWDIKRWEVWNEADLGPQMWSGSLEDYYRFYCVVAKRLKAEFPEIQVGGPAFCNLKPERFAAFLEVFRRCEAPIDFLSWHCYTSDVAHLVAQPHEARKLLDSCGFPETETMINEWHYLLSWEGLHHGFTPEGYEKAINGPAGMHGIDSAAFNVSVIAGWHDTPLDAAHYYGCGEGTWGFVTLYKGLNKNYHSMYLVGQMLTRFPDRVSAVSSQPTVSLLAGTDEHGNGGLLVADYGGDELTIPLKIEGLTGIQTPTVLRLDQSSDLTEVSVRVEGGRMVLPKQERGSAVFFVAFQKGC